VATIG